jgi:hypothetical protein
MRDLVSRDSDPSRSALPPRATFGASGERAEPPLPTPCRLPRPLDRTWPCAELRTLLGRPQPPPRRRVADALGLGVAPQWLANGSRDLAAERRLAGHVAVPDPSTSAVGSVPQQRKVTSASPDQERDGVGWCWDARRGTSTHEGLSPAVDVGLDVVHDHTGGVIIGADRLRVALAVRRGNPAISPRTRGRSDHLDLDRGGRRGARPVGARWRG